MYSRCATGAKVSSKSIPSLWQKPRLGMMIQKFKKDDGFDLGYKYSRADFKCVLDKVLEWSRLTPEQRFPKTHTTKSFQPDQSKDGVFEEPPKNPPEKAVWTPKAKGSPEKP